LACSLSFWSEGKGRALLTFGEDTQLVSGNRVPCKQLAFGDGLVTLCAPDQAQSEIDYYAILSAEVCSSDDLADCSFLCHSNFRIFHHSSKRSCGFGF